MIRERGKGKTKERRKKRKKREQKTKAEEKKAEKTNKKSHRSKLPMKCTPSTDTSRLDLIFSHLSVEDNGLCSGYGIAFSQEENADKFWIFCDMCEEWLCFKYHTSTK